MPFRASIGFDGYPLNKMGQPKLNGYMYLNQYEHNYISNPEVVSLVDDFRPTICIPSAGNIYVTSQGAGKGYSGVLGFNI